ncbi:MAG: hybrid sensor histidine kinase/response regulator [Anaerolineaceae bacterium]|nr:hybrid sensor histidine kinase/response regulator [Anaerolineaceae bacterium]MCB9098446.1 hybrid sensor histidine kinase/response regulator [Anaerolineales bacterium]
MTVSAANQPANILVVDDTKANLRLLAEILSQRGYQVRPATNGSRALAAAQADPPDLILLDIMMPDMDGYAVCEQLKAAEPTRNIPIIFLSALNEVLDKVKAFSSGGVDYITKPFQVEEVLARVETHLTLRQMQKSLEEKNHELEQEITQRRQANEALQKALQELKDTQAQLVESEKMAALGGLVAGVAHEINNPVGFSITAASVLEDETKALLQAYRDNNLKRSDLEAYLNTAEESSQLILRNLQQAAEMVKNFKQVAVDQNSLEKRSFNLKKYLEETIYNLTPKLKKTGHELTINGDDTIMMDSYPGALAQIVTNLVLNSIIHAYSAQQVGHLYFNLSQTGDKVIIQYADDGSGIPAENLGQIFEPFFTTARSQGGSGLGLHIVYNLVTQKLKGSIYCDSTLGKGTQFTLELPSRLNQ